MYGPIFFAPPKPPPKGSQWRKRGETLSWSVVEAEQDRVVLEGPGSCTGKLYLDLNEFARQYVRV